MEDVIILLIWLSICGYWLYLHLHFHSVLKANEPELYKANSGWSPIKYTTGFACFDLALRNGHKQSKNIHVVQAGNNLVRAYEVKFKVMGYGLLISCVIYILAVTLWTTN